MTTMTGSPKQITWATDLKAGVLTGVDQWIEDFLRQVHLPESVTADDVRRAGTAAAEQAADTKTSASWWIDNTTHGPMQIGQPGQVHVPAEILHAVKDGLRTLFTAVQA